VRTAGRVTALAAAALLALCGAARGAEPSAATLRAATAADLQAELGRLRGRVVVLSFWATWCTSCLREIPDLVALGSELAAEGVTVLGVDMDEPRDLEGLVRPFHAKHFPAFHTLARSEPDMDTIASVVDPAWNEVLPTTYLIARSGRVVERLQGAQTPEELRRRVRAALAAP
jgi:thiol-disulfide isomerase/thioredoxin